MDVLYDWAPAILILGLVLAAVGAGVAARAVILTQLQADALASTQRERERRSQGRALTTEQGCRRGPWAGRSRNNCSDRWDRRRGVPNRTANFDDARTTAAATPPHM
jgi:hypothetical protein